MKILIVEDDFISRQILKEILSEYGDCDIVIDGEEAIQAFQMAAEENSPYDLVCLDIMMPNMNGQDTLKQIREIEKKHGVRGSQEVKVIMVTALGDPRNVFEAFYKGGATSYIMKPINKDLLLKELSYLGFHQ